MTSVAGGEFVSQDQPLYSDGVSGSGFNDPEGDFIDDEIDDEENYEYLTNYYFRAGHDGCDEYTNLTTFHGMIRVFKSRNCPSLIFWCLVVTTCLVFYIMVCGTMIKAYSKQPSFMRMNETINEQFDSLISLCADERIVCNDVIAEIGKLSCQQIDMYCVSIQFSTKVKIRLKNKGIYFKHGTELDVHHLVSNPHTHHRIQLKIFQIERINLYRAPCTTLWTDVPWISEVIMPDQSQNYSLKMCEQLRYNLTGNIIDKQKDFPCQPACLETRYKINHSQSRQSSQAVSITFSVFPTVTYMLETRKTTIIDILCYLGGASSLFMGCSCVTLMEMFVFLFKLVTNSVCSEKPPEPDDSFYEDKYAFEYSDNRNRRRYAICDRETMEHYLLSQNSLDVRSINLDKRLSVFSHSAIKKAPKLKSLKDNRNFDNVDIYDTGMVSQSTREDSLLSPKDETSVDYQDEKLDTLGEPWIPEPKRSRPPLRRASTATSHASHTSKGSSSTMRSFVPVQHNRKSSRAFTKNMPMNDF